jgi:hypothetical protein
LDVFANSSSGQLMQASFNGTSWSSWSGVPDDAGTTCCLKTDTSPTVASSAPGRMDVLVLDNLDRLAWKRFRSATWSTIKPIGGRLAAPPAAIGYGGSRISLFGLRISLYGSNNDSGLWMRRHFKRTKGDWDGDGRADFALLRTDGTIHVKPFANTPEIVKSSLASPAVALTGDYDADGLMDAINLRTTDYTWFVKMSSSSPLESPQFGAPGDLPVIADYDGDGRDDFAVVRPPNFDWFVRLSTPHVSDNSIVPWGTTNDIPVPGDYDGDGRDDKAVWRPSTGEWWVIRSSTGVSGVWQTFGISGDKPFPGDYDGDGKTDPAVFRPSNGTWFIKLSSDGTDKPVVWSPSGNDIKRLVRDFDGDGRTDLAYFKTSDQTWHVRSIWSETELTPVPFGQSTDTPF